jgi:hypothetical protein
MTGEQLDEYHRKQQVAIDFWKKRGATDKEILWFERGACTGMHNYRNMLYENKQQDNIMVEMEAMKAANKVREQNNEALKYSEESFMDLIE